MRLALLLFLALATPALADQKTETVTTGITNASVQVAVARPSRTSLFVQNVTAVGPAYCCFNATSCAANAGALLVTGGGSISFDLNDGMNGPVYCFGVGTAISIYVLETWR